jgi:hypothetical protein
VSQRLVQALRIDTGIPIRMRSQNLTLGNYAEKYNFGCSIVGVNPIP